MSAKPRVIVSRRLPEAVEAELLARFDAALGDDAGAYDRAAFLARAEGAAGLVVTLTEKLDADAIGALAAKGLRAIATVSVGVDHLDLAAARAQGVIVTNTPGAVVEDTADIAFLLILAAARRASEGERILRARAWIGWRPTQLLGMSLGGRTLGLVGLGGIGRAVARRARGFGLRVLYHGPRPKPADEAEGAEFVADLEAMLPRCDIVSLHCPSTAETRGLLDARRLALLPPGAIVVNTARGDLVDDAALIAALRSGHVAAAGLDVYKGEPALDPGYYGVENAVLLPHLGTATRPTRTEMARMALEGVTAALAGAPVPFRVA